MYFSFFPILGVLIGFALNAPDIVPTNESHSETVIVLGMAPNELDSQATGEQSKNQTHRTIPSWVFEYDWRVVGNKDIYIVYHLNPPTNSGKNHYVALVSYLGQQDIYEGSYTYSDGEIILAPPAGSDTVVLLVINNNTKSLQKGSVELQRVVRKNYTN